jgi:hypothetical protein
LIDLKLSGDIQTSTRNSVVCLFTFRKHKHKLGGDLGLGSQISMHVLVSRFDCFLYCKQTNKQTKKPAKITVLQTII